MQIGGTYIIDFAKISEIPKFITKIKTGDRKRTIKLVLLKNNEVLNLNNYTVVVAAKKSDRTDIFNDVKIIDAQNGICEVEITDQMLTLNIDLPCEIVLYESDGTVASSSNFVISVLPSVKDAKNIVSSNEFKALTNALTKILEWDNYFEQTSGQIEQKYTERLNTIEKEKKGLSSKHLEVINCKSDSIGTTNIANFAGQDLGSNAPIGQIFHHYTDGTACQIDNVGENNDILVLKNANNEERRLDKDSNFIGTGKFIQCLEHKSSGPSKRIFILDKDGNMYWFDANKTVTLGNNKEDDGTSSFKIASFKKHGKLIEVENEYSTEFLMNHNKINDVLELVSGINASGGMNIQTIKGPLQLTSGDGQIIINGSLMLYKNNTYQTVQTIKIGTPETRPTPNIVGEFYFDNQLNKPLWCKQVDPPIWVNANGDII